MRDERLTDEDIEYIKKRGCMDHFVTLIFAVLISVLIISSLASLP